MATNSEIQFALGFVRLSARAYICNVCAVGFTQQARAHPRQPVCKGKLWNIIHDETGKRKKRNFFNRCWSFRGGDFYEQKKLPFNQVAINWPLFAGRTQFFACTQTRRAGRGSYTCYSWSKNQTNCFAEDTLRKPVANGASQSLRNKKLEQFDYGD